MGGLFDIFHVDGESRYRWVEPAESIEAAEQRISDLSKTQPGDYLIANVSSGLRIIIKRPKTVAA